MDTKKSIKRTIWHKVTDPRIKNTTKATKKDKEGNSEGCSVKKRRQEGPTEQKADMGAKDAAEGTRTTYIQMDSKAIVKQGHHLYEAVNKPATKTPKTNMANEKNHREVDTQEYAYKTRLL